MCFTGSDVFSKCISQPFFPVSHTKRKEGPPEHRLILELSFTDPVYWKVLWTGVRFSGLLIEVIHDDWT